MRVVFISFLFLANLSCSNNRKDLFNSYVSRLCSFQKNKTFTDSLAQAVKKDDSILAANKHSLESLTDVYDVQKTELENKVSQVSFEYEQKVIRLTQQHEAKYGHMITKQYESNLKSLEDAETKKLKPLEEKIALLDKEKEGNNELDELQKTVNNLKTSSISNHEILRQCQSEVNKLQKETAVLEAQIMNDAADKKQIQDRLKKIQQNPCNQ
jgi:hypothetical protein